MTRFTGTTKASVFLERLAEAKREWELFDCEKDPLELFNVWNQAEYHTVRRRC